ncbi:MAG TPA: ribbon-helix-helix protein, CopG family [Tepidisphaeraceae bacterium]|nr:ribbon-helix-helix protein, CopG family [Tepidisphaeraceae bacterium]
MLSVRIPHELNEKLERLMERTGLSRTEVVERALWVGLSGDEKLIRDLENPLYGPLARLATHEAIVKVAAFLMGSEPDPIVTKARQHVVERIRTGKTRRRSAAE